MKQSNTFVFSGEIKKENPAPGVTRQVMAYNNDCMMVKVFFDKGAIGTPHSHPHTQLCYIAEGKFEVEINNQVQILNQGDCFYAEPNVVHGVKCLETGLLIDTFAPMREDFLSK